MIRHHVSTLLEEPKQRDKAHTHTHSFTSRLTAFRSIESEECQPGGCSLFPNSSSVGHIPVVMCWGVGVLGGGGREDEGGGTVSNTRARCKSPIQRRKTSANFSTANKSTNKVCRSYHVPYASALFPVRPALRSFGRFGQSVSECGDRRVVGTLPHVLFLWG